MGLLDFDFRKVTENPLFQLGSGIAGANYGHYGAFAPALQGGIQNMTQQQHLQRQAAIQRMQQEELQRKLQEQNKQREWMQQNLPTMAGAPDDVRAAMLSQKYPKPGTFGTTPYFDTSGNAWQLGSDGRVHKVGPSIQKPLTMLNMGGYYAAVDPITGSTRGPGLAKTLAPGELPSVRRMQAESTAQGTEFGKRGAEAVVDLPKITAAADEMISQIDDLVGHPGLPYITGASSVLPVPPGTPAADAETRLKQLQGGVFLQAYQDLRGGGQITEVEGIKAEQAKARMARAQTEQEFVSALKEFRNIIANGAERARRAATKAVGGSQMQRSVPQQSSGWTVEEE